MSLRTFIERISWAGLTGLGAGIGVPIGLIAGFVILHLRGGI